MKELKKFNLKQIINFLIENSLEFDLVEINPNIKEVYSFASIRNVIQNGIYYFQNAENITKYGIKGNIIVTNKKIKTDNTLIIVPNPQLVHYKLSTLAVDNLVHSISSTAKINNSAIIKDNVLIGENTVIGKCLIEKDVVIMHNVVIEDDVIIRKGSFIDSNSVIGAGGLAWIWGEKGERIIQPQLGGVIIEEDCKLATDVTVARGSLSEDTIIGKGTVIAHGTKIGHGAQISEYVHMANNVSIAGNAIVGERCFLGSGCVVSSNVSIAPNCVIGAGSVVNKAVLEEFCTLAGVPAKIIRMKNFESKPTGAPKPFLKIKE